jgi:hypothetical protein
MTDLVEALKALYLKAYRGNAKNRVARMDLLSVAIHYATTGHRDLAWEIAATLGVKP